MFYNFIITFQNLLLTYNWYKRCNT